MAKPKLSIRQKTTLRLSSREAIQGTFIRFESNFRRYFRNNRWIGVTNRYHQNSVKKLKKDTRRGVGSINHTHLSQYIAVSTPLHCIDGWSYLGRAIDCLARGDANTARHLGYYAELRGAMSLLASEGIGIFSDQHFVVELSGTCRSLPDASGTHKITWLALEHWARLRRSSKLLEEIISPGRIPLRDWFDGFVVTSTRSVGSEWLQSWGLDLRRLSEDREARNEASYRPTRLTLKRSLDVSTCSEFLQSLWALCQPYGDSRFEILDRHLLRLALEKAYKAITGDDVRTDPSGFEARIANMLGVVIPREATPGGLSEEVWQRFLTRRLEPNTPILFTEASGTSPVDDPHHHLQVIARATLLLRVATGASARLLHESGLSSTELSFWWQTLGEDFGLWEPNYAPDELTDLWADVEVALEELLDWGAINSGRQSSIARWWRDRAYAISVLGGCERIALWGLDL